MKVCIQCGDRWQNKSWHCPTCDYTPDLIDGYLAFHPELAAQNTGYASLFPKLAPIEAGSFWFRCRNQLILWALQHYFPEAQTFLEIGCGTGFVLSGIETAFPHLQVCGSEISTAGLEFAAQRLTRAKLWQMDACQIPFAAEFDIIGAFDVLEHIPGDLQVLESMYQATPQTGGIILTVPQHPWLWSQADESFCHVRRYSRRELKTKVERSGFKIVRMTSFVAFLLPLMLLARWQQRKPDPNYDVMTELALDWKINAILESILSLEIALIKLGISFPAGGSLILVAKKN